MCAAIWGWRWCRRRAYPGLAALGERMLPPEMGSLLNTIVLSSAVLYEIAGPGLAKLALHLAGALKPTEKEVGKVAKEERGDALRTGPAHP